MTQVFPGRTGPRRQLPAAAPGRPRRPPRPVTGLDEGGTRTRDRIVIGALLIAGTLGTLGIWVVHGGVGDVLGRSPDSVMTSLGRLTGLLSAESFAVLLVMMARVPVVERALGQDQLVRRHRGVGVAAVALLVVHVGTVTQGYAIGAGATWAAELVDLVLHYPDMIAAAGATACLLLVAVTSASRVRRRVRYETWHLLHLYSYLGIALAIPHETSLGTELEDPTPARLLWWAGWAVAFGSVLVWRLGRPVVLSLRHRLVVDRVERESADSVSVYVRGRDLHRLQAAPGQFMIWRFLSGPGWTRGHPYSLSEAPSDTSLRITVRDRGDGSSRLADLLPGTRVVIEGPYGRMHSGVHPGGPAVLIGSGVGITPLRAMLDLIDAHPGELTLIYRATAREELVLADEIDRLAAVRGITVHYLLGRRRPTRRRSSWLPDHVGAVSDADMLRSLAPGVGDQHVYICGGAGWSDAVRQACLEVGVPASHVHGEFVAW